MAKPLVSRKKTAADVAKLAGTSPAAVSRAFRPGSSMSAPLREKILIAARSLGYLSPAAQALSALGTGTITLVAGDLENPFYPVVANSFSQAIHAQGRRMVLHAVPPAGDVDSVIGQVLDFRSDAAIVASALMSSRLAQACRRQRMPVVLFNRVQPDAGMTAVTCDNYGGGRLVAQRFLAGGRRRIAMIGGRADTSTHLERARGFRDVLDAAGIALIASPTGNFDYATSYTVAQRLLASPQHPEALFCINDVMAMAALDAARDAGLSVPGDLAVIGFDDIPMAAWSSYQLTSVRQPIERMVADALQLVDGLLADPAGEGAIRIVPVSLIERRSG